MHYILTLSTSIMWCPSTPFILIVLLVIAFGAVGVSAMSGLDCDVTDPVAIARMVLAMLLVVAPELLASEPDCKKRRVGENGERQKTVPRCRRLVPSIMNELGDAYIPRAYRMKRKSFWILFNKLYPHLKNKRDPAHYSKKKHRNGARNGITDPAARLSMAIRYFAGGSPVDIALVHGVSPREVHNTIWEVVDAVNGRWAHSETWFKKKIQKRSKKDIVYTQGLPGSFDHHAV